MAGHPTGVRVKRKPGMLYYVKKDGQVMETRRHKGGKAGRKSCWPRKSPVTGRKIAHPRFGTEGRKSFGGRKTGRRTSRRTSR